MERMEKAAREMLEERFAEELRLRLVLHLGLDLVFFFGSIC